MMADDDERNDEISVDAVDGRTRSGNNSRDRQHCRYRGFLVLLTPPRRETVPQRFGMGSQLQDVHLLRHGHGLVEM